MSEWITRNQAREKFKRLGLGYRHISRTRIYLLLAVLEEEFERSRNNPESMDNVSPRTKKKFVLKLDGDGGIEEAYLYMSGSYFKKRECISFNIGGFIGFAGWASDGNVQPVLRAFMRWCDMVASYWQEDLEIEGVDVNGVIESYKDHLFRVTGAGESQMDAAIRQALRPQPNSDAIAEFEREFGAPNA